MKKCTKCGFEGEFLTHICRPPVRISEPDSNGRVWVPVFDYEAFVFDIEEFEQRRFGLTQVSGK